MEIASSKNPICNTFYLRYWMFVVIVGFGFYIASNDLNQIDFIKAIMRLLVSLIVIEACNWWGAQEVKKSVQIEKDDFELFKRIHREAISLHSFVAIFLTLIFLSI